MSFDLFWAHSTTNGTEAAEAQWHFHPKELYDLTSGESAGALKTIIATK